MLKILGRAASINVRKVLWTAGELGLPHEREDWGGPDRPTAAPEFERLNPNWQVPVLLHDGFVLWESQAIMRYLAALAGDTPLYPSAPRQRALVDQWLDWHATEFNPSWSYALLALVRKVPGYDDPARIAASIAAWNRQVALLDRHFSNGRRHVAGDDFTLADISIALGLHRWSRTPISDRPRFVHVERYLDVIAARPEHGRWCRPDMA